MVLWASQMQLMVKNPPVIAGDIRDVGWIPALGRSPGGGHGSPLQYSRLGNPTDRGGLVGYSPSGGTRVGHDLATKQQQVEDRVR